MLEAIKKEAKETMMFYRGAIQDLEREEYEKVDEIIEKGHRRPSGGAILRGYVIPAEIGGEIHRTASRQEALGGEVGTIASASRKIEEQGVAAKGPGLSIVDGPLTIIGLNKNHG